MSLLKNVYVNQELSEVKLINIQKVCRDGFHSVRFGIHHSIA